MIEGDQRLPMPLIMRLGLIIFSIGGVFFLIYHGGPVEWTGTLDGFLGEDAELAHLLIFIGMSMATIGLFSGRGQVEHQLRESKGDEEQPIASISKHL